MRIKQGRHCPSTSDLIHITVDQYNIGAHIGIQVWRDVMYGICYPLTGLIGLRNLLRRIG